MVISTVVSAAACGGAVDDTETPCTPLEPPPIVDDARVLRLDVVDLSERRSSSYGFDLDGVCTMRSDPESASCQRFPGAVTPVDGDGGVDNAFARSLVVYIEAAIARPSDVMSGYSYLQTKSDGSGTLYLGTAEGIRLVIPLVKIRIAPGAGGALSTLAAIVPRAELIASVRARFELVYPRGGCSGSTVDSVATAIAQASDVLLRGGVDRGAECDGISLAIGFQATPVDAPPSVPRGCVPTSTDDDVTKARASWREGR